MTRQVVDVVAPQITAAGYSRREGHFHRGYADGFVQVLVLSWRVDERADETFGHDRIGISFGVCLPVARDQAVPDDPAQVTLAAATLSASVTVLPSPTVIAEVLEERVLPWLDATDGRDALAAWATEDPERIDPPAQRPLVARLLTEWGHPDAARRVHPAGPSR